MDNKDELIQALDLLMKKAEAERDLWSQRLLKEKEFKKKLLFANQEQSSEIKYL